MMMRARATTSNQSPLVILYGKQPCDVAPRRAGYIKPVGAEALHLCLLPAEAGVYFYLSI